MLERFLEAYDAVLVLDTETTGISCRKDEIIELAVLKAGQADGALCELETMDEFIRLSEGRRLPDKIVELTGITEQMLPAENERDLEKLDESVRGELNIRLISDVDEALERVLKRREDMRLAV